MIFKQQVYNAGLYCRLSDEDDLDGESCSIESQKKIMEQYCNGKGINMVGFYQDDGYSGTNFERPDFKRLLDDIKMGKINLVITKDLSRFGRNYVDTGYYIEQVFDGYNVRYIAIDDAVDTLQGENMVMPIKNMMNDWYAKDISKKTKSSLNARAKSGLYLASKPAYGYVKDSDGHHLIIDPEAAAVVQRIFQLAGTSLGYNGIAKHLTKNGILTPQSYFASQHPEYFKKKVVEPHCDWNNKTLQVILNNPIYLGNTVYGKTRSKKIRSKERSARPEDEWIVASGTHEAIVTQEMWDTAHERLNSRKRETKSGDVHIFSGYLFCKDCGAAMTFNNRDFKKELNGEFLCGTYKRKGKGRCTTHYITFENVYNVVLQDVRVKAEEANRDEQQFLSSLAQESERLMAQDTVDAAGDVTQMRVRIEQLDQIISRMYEDRALGVIPVERFNAMFAKYESEQKGLKAEVAQHENRQRQQDAREDKTKAFIEFIKEVVDAPQLTPVLLSRLIKRITVGQVMPNPITGKKEQDIEIEYAIWQVVK